MADQNPTLLPEDFFRGRTRGWGMIQDRFGRLRRRFVVDMTGHVAEGMLTLDETFNYDDGRSSRRTWRVRQLTDGRYEGRADDIVGVAAGSAAGPIVRWSYRMRIDMAGRLRTFSLSDLMVLQGDGVLLNRIEMRKFGIRLADVFVVFTRLDLPSDDLPQPQSGST